GRGDDRAGKAGRAGSPGAAADTRGEARAGSPAATSEAAGPPEKRSVYGGATPGTGGAGAGTGRHGGGARGVESLGWRGGARPPDPGGEGSSATAGAVGTDLALNRCEQPVCPPVGARLSVLVVPSAST